jgi:CDP-paratose 2-epimerase
VDCVIVTGSSGLVGSAASHLFAEKGLTVIGLDNDMRAYFFGPKASTHRYGVELDSRYQNFYNKQVDIRNVEDLREVFSRYGDAVSAVVHCAAQPSHDWAAREPVTDFTINALGTLNLLEMTRNYCPEASFIFMSTNKVYGDGPNYIRLVEEEKRWSPAPAEHWANGFSEELSIDGVTHSLFGVSKASADLLVQEYGRYFGMRTVCFRGGCLTGPSHAGAELHGFLSYLVKCVVNGMPYTVFGYKGKQVRDNIHTDDLVSAFWHFVQDPSEGAVFNIGGGMQANVSMLEAIEMVQDMAGRELHWTLDENHRKGDHVWYVSDLTKFQQRYPEWSITRDIEGILKEMVNVELAQGQ